MLLTLMLRNLALALACLTFVGTGRQVQNSIGRLHNSFSAASQPPCEGGPLDTFARFLWFLNPTVAFDLSAQGSHLTVRRPRRVLQLFMNAAACSPPVARRIPRKVAFGKVAGENRGSHPMEPPIELVDDYFWLGDKDELARNKSLQGEVLQLFEKENAYTLSSTENLEALRQQLYFEMSSRIEPPFNFEFQVAVASALVLSFGGFFALLISYGPTLPLIVGAVAVLLLSPKLLFVLDLIADTAETPILAGDGYEYWMRRNRLLEGLNSLQYCRRQPGAFFSREVILDLGQICSSSFFLQEPGWEVELCDVSAVATSPSGKLLAYSVDGSGREIYNIRFKELSTGTEFNDCIPQTNGAIAWAGERTIFYTRGGKVWRHVLNTRADDDVVVYEEADESFQVFCGTSLDESLVFIVCRSSDTSEYYFIPTKKPDSLPTLIRAREPGVVYSVESHAPSQSLFLIANADGKVNGELFVASLNSPSVWKPVVTAGTQILAHSASRSIDGVQVFSSFLVVGGREDGLPQFWIVPLAATGAEATSDAHRMVFDDEVVTPELAENGVFESNGKLRVRYSSLSIPNVLVEYDVTSRRYTTLKKESGTNYDPSLYKTVRTEVTARDGVAIPVTMMWRPDEVGNGMEPGGGGVPCHVYGYGAYGTCSDPDFSIDRISLVDRGIVYVIAHVRGGGEMGNHAWWEESGKYLRKLNSFNDFVDVAQALVDRGIAKPGAISCEGESAGGLLVGSVVNMAPQLFTAALAVDPFVDLMVTMCDPSIALTTIEWKEWGNPNEVKYHEYMKSYSPINNVRDGKTYPSMLISASLNDTRVGHWESAKWAQVLRSRIANGDDVLVMMDNAGHQYTDATGEGVSSMYQKQAFQYAWLLDKLGKRF